jgi:hypothetical protein
MTVRETWSVPIVVCCFWSKIDTVWTMACSSNSLRETDQFAQHPKYSFPPISHFIRLPSNVLSSHSREGRRRLCIYFRERPARMLLEASKPLKHVRNSTKPQSYSHVCHAICHLAQSDALCPCLLPCCDVKRSVPFCPVIFVYLVLGKICR